MPLLIEKDSSGTQIIARVTFGDEQVCEPPLKESKIKKMLGAFLRLLHGE